MAKMVDRLDAEKIEAVIGYRFQEKSFLMEAFTHTSYLPNRLTRSYERLEVSCASFCANLLLVLNCESNGK